MPIPEIDFDELYCKLKARQFNLLTLGENIYLMLSIIDESKDTNFLGEHDEVDCQSVFGLDDRSVSAENAIRAFIEDEFEPAARKKLSIAATTLCVHAYEGIRAGNADDMSLLRHVLSISWNYNTLVDSDVGFVIALDRVMPAEIRQLGARHLVGGRFRSQGSPATWKRLEDEIPRCPSLVIPVMEHYIDDQLDPVQALKAAARVDLPRGRLHLGNEFELTIAEAFQLCREPGGSVGELIPAVTAVCKTFSPELAEWVRDILNDTDNGDLDVYLTKFPCAVA